MRKILFVSTCYPNELLPQYCIFIEQQALALISLNEKVDVLVPTVSNSKYERFHGIDVFNIKYRESILCGVNCSTNKAFKNELLQLLIRNAYDVVSIHLCPDEIINIVIKTCKKLDIRTVIHYHGLNVWKNYYQLHPSYEYFKAIRRKCIISNADAIVGVSNKVIEIVKTRIASIPCFTVYNGVDCALFRPRELDGDGVFRIVCVANLAFTKGQRYLIEAIHKITKSNRNIRVQLDVVGDGPDAQILRGMANDLRVQDIVLFHGYIGYQEVASILEKADIFVLPSFFEALGCVYLEAMASRVPVIGCRGQGIEEIINNGVNGICVSPQNSDELATNIVQLIENNEMRRRMAENGYEMVRNNYTWTCSAKHLINVYDVIC